MVEGGSLRRVCVKWKVCSKCPTRVTFIIMTEIMEIAEKAGKAENGPDGYGPMNIMIGKG